MQSRGEHGQTGFLLRGVAAGSASLRLCERSCHEIRYKDQTWRSYYEADHAAGRFFTFYRQTGTVLSVLALKLSRTEFGLVSL